MRYERVHTIWDIYDGVRTGTADFNSVPHYFESLYDEVADDYSGNFKLYPVGSVFMQRALRNWHIYRSWEKKFHSGEVDLKTHPGHGGIDPEYDENESWLKEEIAHLQSLPPLYKARFRDLPGQEGLLLGILHDLEVKWIPSPG